MPKYESVGRKKAKKILRHGAVRGRPLTTKQRGFFGARAAGKPLKKGSDYRGPGFTLSEAGYANPGQERV
jgi:hypothetical protein